MRRFLVVALWATTVVAVAVAQEKSAQSLESELRDELQGREFTTKVVVASQLAAGAGAFWVTVGSGPGALVVDTELDRDGTMRYLVPMRQPGGILQRSFHIDVERIDRVFPPGTRVTVVGVDVMRDRIELRLRDAEGAPGKLKCMLGRNFEKSFTVDDVLGFIGRALKIARVERAVELMAEFQTLTTELVEHEKVVAAAADAEGKLRATRALAAVVKRLAENRAELARLRRTPLPVDARQFTGRLEDLEQQISALESGARQERVRRVEKALSQASEEASRIRARVGQGQSKDVEEWKVRLRAVEEWEANLAHRRSLLEQLAAEGGSTTQAQKALEVEREELARMRETLGREESRLQVARLEAEYAGLERQRLRLLDAYTRAFGTAGQPAAAEALLKHLRVMYENRIAAQRLGAAAAAQQAEKIKAEMNRVER